MSRKGKITNKQNDTLKIIIDDIPPSNNIYLGKRKDYFTYQKTKKDWSLLVRNALPMELPEIPITKATIDIHYIFPDKRKRDLDNYSGKFLLDPLVNHGILLDDCYEVLTKLNLSAEHIPKIRKTIIEVHIE